MAYPRPTRSCLSELDAGATDGKYRKVIADRGGVVEHTFLAEPAGPDGRVLRHPRGPEHGTARWPQSAPTRMPFPRPPRTPGITSLQA